MTGQIQSHLLFQFTRSLFQQDLGFGFTGKIWKYIYMSLSIHGIVVATAFFGSFFSSCCVVECFSGDTDGRVPVLSTRYSLSSLSLSVTKSWRPWYHENEVIKSWKQISLIFWQKNFMLLMFLMLCFDLEQVSGWFEEYEGLTFATFRGAGHAVPCFKPSNSLAFFTSFLNGESPPSTK